MKTALLTSEQEQEPTPNKDIEQNDAVLSNTDNFRAQKTQDRTAICYRYLCSVIHLSIMAVYSYYLIQLSSDNKYRKIALIACGWIYFLRVVYTMHFMLQRRIIMTEIFVTLIFQSIIHFSFGFKKSIDINQDFNYIDIVFILLYIVGSFFNSYSEIQRKQFKKLATSKGKLYTEGLFKYSRHPNYFGDALLFAGWGLLTWKFWNVWVSLFMSFTFVSYHIPDLEKYLKQRYSKDWDQYQNTVAPFIPFVQFPKYKL
eukprot:152394_1